MHPLHPLAHCAMAVLCALGAHAAEPATPEPAGTPEPAVYQDWEPPADKALGNGAAYHDDPTNNSRRTDHFIFRWGPASRDGFINEALAQGHLQMLEHAFDNWRELGFRGLGGKAPGKAYRAVIMPYASWPWLGSFGAVGFMEGPGVIGINVPTNALAYTRGNGCTPHEIGHGWQNQGGLPAAQPPGWSESLANWYMSLFLVDYPSLMPAIGVTPNHACQNYNQYSIFQHFLDRPGYGSAFINRLVFAPNLNSFDKPDNDDIYRKAVRVDTSGVPDPVGTFHDELGLMNARMLDMDFWNHDFDRQYARVKDAEREFFFFNRTALVRQPGVPGEWWRPELLCIPQAGANAFVPLTITAKGPRRTVTCEFRPQADALNGSAYRACFVAYNRNGEARYGRIWNAGENSFVLADDEEAVYLTVYGLPKISRWSIRNNDYTSAPLHQFPFRMRLVGATPREFRQAPPKGGSHRHANGGGVVADTAEVEATAYVGPDAMVLGSAKVLGKARIEDFAVVSGKAVIGRKGQPDDPVVSGYAYVTDEAEIDGHGKVREHAWVFGKAQIHERGVAMSHSMLKDGKLHGDAVLVQTQLRDRGLCLSGDYSGYAIRGGDQSGGGAYDKKVWLEFPDEEDHSRRDKKPDNEWQYLGYTFEKRGAIFAMDQYGLFHGYLMNGPQVVADQIAGVATNVLALDGKTQYVEVCPSAIDRPDTTITMWVKWNGTAGDQRIFSFGDGAKKAMWLTPKSATTGKLRFTIGDGTLTRNLDGAAPLKADTWTHIALTFAAGGGALWVDGKAVARDHALGLAPDQLHAPLMADANYLGRGDAGDYFAGRIDEFRIFMKAFEENDIAAAMKRVVPGPPAPADSSPPTPAPAWLVAPVIAPKSLTGSAIAMSAVEGSDANGVLYSFHCEEDPGHDSGWLSEPRYIDAHPEPGKTYTFTVTMRDLMGNQTAASPPARIQVPPADVQAPQVAGPSFSVPPRGTADGAITMTAAAATDADELVMYRFTRVGTQVTSGWSSSRTWTDSGLPSGGSAAYTVEAQDGRGNAGKPSEPSPKAVARDDTPPALGRLHRMQWDSEPIVQLDGSVRMSARMPAEQEVDYRFECVEKPEIASAWLSSGVWVTPPLADGTWSFHFKLRDRSPQRNESGWSTVSQARILVTNRYHDQTVAKLAQLPDSSLVRFTGKVTTVKDDRYIVSDGGASIEVIPRSFARRTEISYLDREVTVSGHLWTYSKQPKQVTYASVVPRVIGRRIECEQGRLLNGAAPETIPSASFHEAINLDGDDEDTYPRAVELDGFPAAKELTLLYIGGEALALYVNGKRQPDLQLATLDPQHIGAATIAVDIPAGATIRLEKVPKRWSPRVDCLILGRTCTVSGTVTGIVRASARTEVSVCLSSSSDPLTYPEYVAKVNDKGEYRVRLPVGEWQVAAMTSDGARIQASPVQKLTLDRDRGDLALALAPLPGRKGKIEAESGLRFQSISMDANKDASGGFCVGNTWGGSVVFANVGPGKRIRLAYGSPGGGPGTFGIYINGKRHAISLVGTGDYFKFKEATLDVEIPEHAVLTLKHDDGDCSPNFDYLVIE